MFPLAVGDLPSSWFSVAGMPIVLALAGGVIWVVGRTSEVKHDSFPWKWTALPVFAIALYEGLGASLRMRDFLYRDAIEPLGKRLAFAHYAAFLAPALLLAGLYVWERMERNKVNSEY